MSKNVLAVVEYDGSNYQGWQSQVNGITIQDNIEKVLSKILNGPIKIYGSGRTDAGVHALGQTFNFLLNKEVEDLNLLKHSFNCLLPNDIKIKSLKYVPLNFNARFNAKEKIYQYRFCIDEANVFDFPYVSIVHKPFDLDKLKEALNLFIGKHCFINFTSKPDDQDNFIRNIFNITLKKNKNCYGITFVGDGFMRYMIRFIVGTCFAYAKGQIELEKIKYYLNDTNRHITTFKAESKGLFLIKVKY